MRKTSFASLIAASFGLAASAGIDLKSKTDLGFAEKYAFSPDRASLVATLKPDSPEWFTYSILLAQTEGRLADAKALLKRWEGLSKLLDRGTFLALEGRETLLEWNSEKPDLSGLRKALGNAGITVNSIPRETPLKPDTYPSKLDPAEVSFDAFKKEDSGLSGSFAFLKDGEFDPHDRNLLPDTPGLLEKAIDYLKNGKGVFRNSAVFSSFVPEQLSRVAAALKGTKADLRGNEAYARIMLSKISLCAEDDPDDCETALELARARVGFVSTLLPALNAIKKAEYAKYLELMLERGEASIAKEEFKTYLELSVPNRPNARAPVDSLVRAYISFYRRANEDLSPYSGLIEERALVKLIEETELLMGVDAEEVDTSVFTPAEFKEIQERVELEWLKSNPKTFAADDDVTLGVDVKNVKKLRISIYELDPFAAMRVVDGELTTALDLDAVVPTSVRMVDYSERAILRHTERISFPELKKRGVYVVDIAGNGVASRALVRKGSLRVSVAKDGAGYVFKVFDEKGELKKNSSLRFGETVFTADESGEIALPFAPDERSQGRKKAIATDGRLAAEVHFDHECERLGLELAIVLPAENMVAGMKAKALLSPCLTVNGVKSPIALLENPVLTLAFEDFDGRERVKTLRGFSLSDSAETPVEFTVPERIRSVCFTLSGSVKEASSGKPRQLFARAWHGFNAVRTTDSIVQRFLLRTASGWRLELRGLSGEPLAAKGVEVALTHRAFSREKRVRLQTDAKGTVDLGPLADIERISVKDSEGESTWNISDDVFLPASLEAREGEAIAIPLKGLFAGEWPGAKDLRMRAALFEVNKAGELIADRFSALSYDKGFLAMPALKAGEYVLVLRDRGLSSRIKVSRSPIKAPEKRVAIASAEVDSARVLKVVLDSFDGDTRVHVFGSRFYLDPGAVSPAEALRPYLRSGTSDREAKGESLSDYVSGRDLGERLRYIMERRDAEGKIGNMLFKPSLLLSPWNVAETATKDVTLRGGSAYGGVAKNSAPNEAMAPMCEPECEAADVIGPGPGMCRDFLAENGLLLTNLRPDEAGRIEVKLPGGFQDIRVVAVGPANLDEASIVLEAEEIEPRNLAYAKSSASSNSRTCESMEELFDLAAALGANIGEFAPLAKWASLAEGEKRDFYSLHISHEVDFYLYMKDRVFFDSVIVPHLKNKRRKDFMDKWLLGEDLSEWAIPVKFDDLNALELNLLARRIPSLAGAIERRMKDRVEEFPTSPDRYDTVFAIALGDAADRNIAAEGGAFSEMQNMVEASDSLVTRGGGFGPAAAPRAMRAMKTLASRKSRQLYRPPERTREWVESYWWKTRLGESAVSLIPVTEFWAGLEAKNFPLAGTTLSAQLCALAFIEPPVAFTRLDGGKDASLVETVRYREGIDGTEAKEFFKGRKYELVKLVTNPTCEDVRAKVEVEIPEGAIALYGAPGLVEKTLEVKAYSTERLDAEFYFPYGKEAAEEERASWEWISQNAPKGEVLKYLKEKNLANVDLGRMQWRMADGEFAQKALEILSERGEFSGELWLAGFIWRDAFDEKRVVEALSRGDVKRRLKYFGPYLDSPLVKIDPETTFAFEHKEYWPIVNAYAHNLSGKVMIANEGLKAEYRDFLDTLAAKKTLSPRDRLLAAVYLIAQERISEAKVQIALAGDAEGEMAMQLDYIEAYLAFSEGDPARGREISKKYVNYPVKLWRERFGEMISTAAEALGEEPMAKKSDADLAPSISLEEKDGELIVSSENLDEVVLKAYPVDAEIAFSKDPFGSAGKGRDVARCMKSAWEKKLEPGCGRVKIPAELKSGGLVVVAEGAGGRAEARLELMPREFEVQIVKEYRQLRVKDLEGKPLKGAYVKVYARGEGEAVFHKDGYTDLRGAFDYASVTTDSAFRPSEYAVMVLSGSQGSAVLRIRE
ncbi:MAG: hypothetical protein K6F50_03620 [Kiritimatiellae bacterium]|nr:hypothetical protein [Kiritimatiellia bacterium]